VELDVRRFSGTNPALFREQTMSKIPFAHVGPAQAYAGLQGRKPRSRCAGYVKEISPHDAASLHWRLAIPAR